MKTPAGLQPLIDDGVIDEVIRSLKSGKEATVYLVRSGAHMRCAKVYRDLVQQVVRMLSIGLIHGDLSEFNVLLGHDGPVIIDLPQAVNAAGNNGALAMLERDVNNLRGTLGRFAPELLQTEFAREMWALFEQGELTADSTLKGVFARDETAADPDAVLLAVEDAREEALRRELGRES